MRRKTLMPSYVRCKTPDCHQGKKHSPTALNKDAAAFYLSDQLLSLRSRVPQPKCVVEWARQLDKVDTNDEIDTLFLALRVPDGEHRWVHSLSGIDQRS